MDSKPMAFVVKVPAPARRMIIIDRDRVFVL